ncbi:lipocalin family protein [Aquabacterium sp. NJ1]|uniref:lipocalin family protein n=1 Tax=Aquabacterium sp. NJ1 TaxID=1538295 RepID=UPI001F458F2B|nr:lipocalin family protein [Aquabacterium sp. NJ1]
MSSNHSWRANGLVAFFCLCGLCCMSAQAQSVGHEPVPGSDGQPGEGTLQAIPSLDLPRYMGSWFEIAKFPNRFQRKCTGATRADYSLQADGGVQVINRCRVDSGETIEVIGAGRQLGPATSPKLEVRFAPAWLSFLPFVWGDYWVIDLDAQYQLVAVSEPKREYLWILSRTPHVAPKDYQALLARLSKMGFDLSKLEATKQD